MAIKQSHFIEDYRKLVQDLIAQYPIDEAMSRAVGGQFEIIGRIEKQLLVQSGLKPDHRVVDVGCGSGRLALALRDYLGTEGGYSGTDVVPELLDYARARCPASWRFTVVEDLNIPAESQSADFVCFFSVLTHLQQHESYVYLMEAQRILRPGGKIAFSWLQYPQNWDVFEATVNAERAGTLVHLNEFLSVDAIKAWADHLGMDVEQIRSGDEPFVQLDGGLHAFGQAVAVLAKR
jgi:SAM-dependent methyltransferase